MSYDNDLCRYLLSSAWVWRFYHGDFYWVRIFLAKIPNFSFLLLTFGGFQDLAVTGLSRSLDSDPQDIRKCRSSAGILGVYLDTAVI